MGTGTRRDSMGAQQTVESDERIQQQKEFLSLYDIGTLILRHRLSIVAIVLLSTLGSAIYFVVMPKQFEAEGYLQVIPTATEETRTDKELFETLIASCLQRVSSGFILKNVSTKLENKGLQISPLDLGRKIKISRPPKTDLIRIVAKETSANEALLITEQWIRECLESIRQNNIQKSLMNIRLLLNKAQTELMERQAAVENLRTQAAQTEPLITISRGVDDRQLWSDLTQKTMANTDALKKLSEIHIKGQEQNEEYINITKALVNYEQALMTARSRCDLYQEVEKLLEIKTRSKESDNSIKGIVEDKTTLSAAERYVNTLLKRNDVIQFGEPGLIWIGHGALIITSLVFLTSLVISSFFAFIYEWWTASGKLETHG
jgi:capsular polysaccharide biosynthesis protein